MALRAEQNSFLCFVGMYFVLFRTRCTIQRQTTAVGNVFVIASSRPESPSMHTNPRHSTPLDFSSSKISGVSPHFRRSRSPDSPYVLHGVGEHILQHFLYILDCLRGDSSIISCINSWLRGFRFSFSCAYAPWFYSTIFAEFTQYILRDYVLPCSL